MAASRLLRFRADLSIFPSWGVCVVTVPLQAKRKKQKLNQPTKNPRENKTNPTKNPNKQNQLSKQTKKEKTKPNKQNETKPTNRTKRNAGDVLSVHHAAGVCRTIFPMRSSRLVLSPGTSLYAQGRPRLITWLLFCH